MTGSQGTLIQQWSLGTTAFLSCLLLLLHLAAGLLAAILCPEMLLSSTYQGDHCTPRGSNSSYLLPANCKDAKGMRMTVDKGVCLTRGGQWFSSVFTANSAFMQDIAIYSCLIFSLRLQLPL